MLAAAEDLRFEYAARLRDEIRELPASAQREVPAHALLVVPGPQHT